MAKQVSNKKMIRIITGDTEIIVTAPVNKAQAMIDTLSSSGSASICSGTFNPTKIQFVNFAEEVVDILYP